MKKLNVIKTAKHFNEKWWKEKKIMLRYDKIIPDILKMLKGNLRGIKTKTIATNRAYLTCKYISDKYKKNSKILDMGCGLGFVSHILALKNYNVVGFDISKDAIRYANQKANELKCNKINFFVDNDNFLKKIKSNSIDVAFGLGFVRYLSKKKEKIFYKNIKRILKKNGTLIVDQQNDLYEMFALNSDTISFWSNTISDYSENKNLSYLKINKLLKQNIQLPKRIKASHSISSKMKVITENPLTYKNKLNKIGLKLEKILYPYCDILPPGIQKKFNEKQIEKIQKKFCLKKADDWRSMFMCFMFLNFIKKVK